MAGPRSSFLNSKTFDVLAVTPLIVWYAFAIAGIAIGDFLPIFNQGFELDWKVLLGFCSQLVAALFIALQLFLFLVRKLSVAKAKGIIPRLVAVLGANSTFAFLALPRAVLPVRIQAMSTAVVLMGTLACILAAFALGRAFSIFPQARQFVASGPYRFVRHPLYLAEQVATWGLMLQYLQPWSFLIALMSLAAQFPRMHYEEQVLKEAFPAYLNYASRTRRLIPGVY